MNKKYMLIIMDGLGMPRDIRRSAVTDMTTPNLHILSREYPSTALFASEEKVGLPSGQAGTSEVGHMTIGAGRVIYQPLVKINKEIESGDFFENKTLIDALSYAKENGKKVHLLGLVSDGGIHSHIEHLLALIKMCSSMHVSPYIHFISDGRDTPPKSVIKYLDVVSGAIKDNNCGTLSTLIGRFYALDRDKNYDRNKLAYKLWTSSEGREYSDYHTAVDEAYARRESDEFITPVVLDNGNGRIERGDVVISFNFRTDRERQTIFVLSQENDLDYTEDLGLYVVTMTEYSDSFDNVHVAYRADGLDNILTEVLSRGKFRQLKVAETEKFAHLTTFFNAGRLEAYDGEDRIIVHSPKMASYASCPYMKAEEITTTVLDKMADYDFIAVNFANSDMVGHSGDFEASKRAVEKVDECVYRLVKAMIDIGGEGIVTADHGNSDIMVYEDGTPCTSHTTNLVPCIVFGERYRDVKLREGGALCDIAPTLLDMMGKPIPPDMTGKSLLK